MSQNIKIVIDRSELQEVLNTTKESLDDTKEAKVKADNFLNNEGVEIKGAEAAGKRIARMYIPGAREVLSIQRSIGQLNAGNLVGGLNLAFLALNIIMQVKQLYDEAKREREEYVRDVMQSRGYDSREQFLSWEQEQKAGLNASRNRYTVR